MIEGNRINDHEFVEVVLERDVVSMPSYHVERAVALLRGEQFAVILANDLVICFTVLVTGDRSLEISWIRQAIRSCSKRRDIISVSLSDCLFYRGWRSNLPIGPNSGS